MADAITIKALQDASLDAKSLEEVVNGDEAKQVTTRLGGNYPSVKKAIKTLFENGGLPATPFSKYSDMVTSDLPDGSYAAVLNDVDRNNGIYIKEDGKFSKVKLNYPDLGDMISHGFSDNIIEIDDVSGNTLLKMASNGDVFVHGLDESVQSSLSRVKEVASLDITANDNPSLLDIEDNAGVVVASLDSGGVLSTNDFRTHNTTLNSIAERVDVQANDIFNLKISGSDDEGLGAVAGGKGIYKTLLDSMPTQLGKVELLKSIDQNIANELSIPLLHESALVTATEFGNTQTMTPVLIRIKKSQYMLITTEGDPGDFGQSDAVCYNIKVNSDYSVSRGERVVIATRGSDEFGSYGAAGGTGVYLNRGIHAGRIYIYFIKRYGKTKDDTYYTYSDDLGRTWSDPVLMKQFIPSYDAWRLTLASPAKCIQLQRGANAGRIVIPAWHADQNYPTSQAGLKAFILYSDDGGETYQVGAESDNDGSNESAVAEFDDGKIMFITRNATRYKTIEYSDDGGETLRDIRQVDEVQTVKVQSGLVQTESRFDLATPKIVMTSPYSNSRTNLGVFVSYDNLNFEIAKQIQTGVASYSDIEVIDESSYLVVYVGDDYSSIKAITVNLKTIL